MENDFSPPRISLLFARPLPAPSSGRVGDEGPDRVSDRVGWAHKATPAHSHHRRAACQIDHENGGGWVRRGEGGGEAS